MSQASRVSKSGFERAADAASRPPLIVALPGNETLGREIGDALSADLTMPAMRRFPDTRFATGEAVTSRSFAKLVSSTVDALVTVDPHLHRYASLADLYAIPTRIVHAAPLLADWIRAEVENPLLVGPDSESAQWVADVAEQADAPYLILEKTRRGDREVEVSVPDVDRWRKHRPVLVDDIISTARTMTETVGHLARAGLPAPVCVGVHAVFAGDAYHALRAAGADRVVTTDTIGHASNGIRVGGVLVSALRELLA